jgi:hypothetical protein
VIALAKKAVSLNIKGKLPPNLFKPGRVFG